MVKSINMVVSKTPEIKEYPEKHGVILAIYRGNRILLEERTDPERTFYGFTIVPGGGVKEGETFEEALMREVFEERAVAPTVFKQIGVVEEVETDGTLNTRHVFLITDYEGEIVNNEARNRPFWVTLDEAEEVCKHPISKRILTLVRDALNEKEYLED